MSSDINDNHDDTDDESSSIDPKSEIRSSDEVDEFLDSEAGYSDDDPAEVGRAKKKARELGASAGLAYNPSSPVKRTGRTISNFLPEPAKKFIGGVDRAVLGENDGKGNAIRFDANGRRHKVPLHKLSEWEENHPESRSGNAHPSARPARQSSTPSAAPREHDPVDAAQRYAQKPQRRNLSASNSMKPSAAQTSADRTHPSKGATGSGSTTGPTGKKKKKGKDNKSKNATGVADSKGASASGGDGESSSSVLGSMGRGQKETVGLLAGLFILVLCVLLFTPSTIGGNNDANTVAPLMAGSAGIEEEGQLDEDAAAANASDAGQCYTSDVDEDSALNATGGSMFEPGDSDPVAEVAGLQPNQIMHAQEIVAVGKEMDISENGQKIGLMVGSAETGYNNYANNGKGENGPLKSDQDPAELAKSQDSPYSEGLPPGHGGDHGSVGIFQQQYPWWGDGTVESLMNPRAAARWFFEAMLEKAPDYDSQEPATVSQTVQGSAFASGDNYRVKIQETDTLYNKIKDTPAGFNWGRYNGSGGDPKPGDVENMASMTTISAQDDYDLARGGGSQPLILAQDDDPSGSEDAETRDSGATADDLAPSDGSSGDSDNPCANVPSTAEAGSDSGDDIVDREEEE